MLKFNLGTGFEPMGVPHFHLAAWSSAIERRGKFNTQMVRSTLAALGAMILFTATACSGDKGPVAVESVQLAKDNGSGSHGDVVTGFHPGDGALHCVATLNKPENGSKIHFDFIAVDAGGVKNQKLAGVDVTTDAVENIADGHITIKSPWPVGKYQCAVTLNGKPGKTLDYEVTAAS